VPTTVVVIPTYNERTNIARLVPQVLAATDCHVVVVDDDSPDGTPALVGEMAAADPRVHLVNHRPKLGIGPAYKEGFRAALAMAPEFVIQMDAEEVNMSDHVMPSISYVDLAWSEGDVQLAKQHSERALSMATRSGSPYFRTYATACRGLFHIIAGRPSAAIADLTAAIEFARQREAGLEYEPRMLADLANAYRLNGDFDAAARTAADAIDVCVRRHSRVAECLAHIVLGQTLHASGDTGGATVEIRRAEQLMAETGARLYAPLLDDLRSGLPGDAGISAPRTTNALRRF